jgi:hypothetical protein
VYLSRLACTLVTILTELSQLSVVTQSDSFSTTSSDALLKSTTRVVTVAFWHRQAESDHSVACLEQTSAKICLLHSLCMLVCLQVTVWADEHILWNLTFGNVIKFVIFPTYSGTVMDTFGKNLCVWEKEVSETKAAEKGNMHLLSNTLFPQVLHFWL